MSESIGMRLLDLVTEYQESVARQRVISIGLPPVRNPQVIAIEYEELVRKLVDAPPR